MSRLHVDVDEAPAYELLRRLGTDRMPHRNGRTLFEHLSGMATIAKAWRLPEDVRRAALFHSVYGTAVYRDGAAHRDRRDTIRAEIGAAAERLAFAFGGVDRPRFGAAVEAMALPRECTLTTRFGDVQTLSARDVVALALLGTINELEQTCASDGSPASWRSFCRPLVDALVRWNVPEVPPFVRATLTVTSQTEAESIAHYLRAVELVNRDTPAAERAFADVGRSEVRVAEPFVWQSYLATRRGDELAATEFADEARLRLVGWGTPWDKRLTLEDWLEEIDGRGATGASRLLQLASPR
ncbi:MAG: hypothetical protein IAI49_07750 [Candidatus Eremiobacteraeota bacterium]|nr:hypothetical protein [Candidatus Eremiobacteraeota bacterium]